MVGELFILLKSVFSLYLSLIPASSASSEMVF